MTKITLTRIKKKKCARCSKRLKSSKRRKLMNMYTEKPYYLFMCAKCFKGVISID